MFLLLLIYSLFVLLACAYADVGRFDSDIDHDRRMDYDSKTYVTNIRDSSGA